jgi:hypothetical protein
MDVAALNSRVVMEMKPEQVMVGKKDGKNANGKEVRNLSTVVTHCPDHAQSPTSILSHLNPPLPSAHYYPIKTPSLTLTPGPHSQR